MNRLANTRNRYQTEAKKVLTVCSAGLLRSPTVANVLYQLYGYNTRACGYHPDYALIVLDEVLWEWADEVVFVEPDVQSFAKVYHSFIEEEDKPTKILNLPDKFEWNNEELRQAIKEQYNESTSSL